MVILVYPTCDMVHQVAPTGSLPVYWYPPSGWPKKYNFLFSFTVKVSSQLKSFFKVFYGGFCFRFLFLLSQLISRLLDPIQVILWTWSASSTWRPCISAMLLRVSASTRLLLKLGVLWGNLLKWTKKANTSETGIYSYETVILGMF